MNEGIATHHFIIAKPLETQFFPAQFEDVLVCHVRFHESQTIKGSKSLAWNNYSKVRLIN